ncbi:TPX2 domain-containing protein, partial [Cephalotus follicularis]
KKLAVTERASKTSTFLFFPYPLFHQKSNPPKPSLSLSLKQLISPQRNQKTLFSIAKFNLLKNLISFHMDSNVTAKNAKTVTPVKDSHGFQSKNHQDISRKFPENSNPNISQTSLPSKPIYSPVNKSAKSQKSAPRNAHQSSCTKPAFAISPRNKIRERKFVVAKKKKEKKEKEDSDSSNDPAVDCKCKERYGRNVKKCLCVAYETLRASQEEFFKNGEAGIGNKEAFVDRAGSKKIEEEEEEEEEEEMDRHCFVAQNRETEDGNGADNRDPSEVIQLGKTGSSTVKRRRDKLLEEARNSVPEFGKVMHLVNAFEKLLSIPKSKESDEKENASESDVNFSKKIPTKWALPGLQRQESISSFCPSDLLLTSENLGLDSHISVSSSWDSQGSISSTSRTSNGGRRSRRNSFESCGTMRGRRWKKKQLKVTSQKPFKLRTEQRGRAKEEEFMKKVEEMMTEEEKLRIPVAQGLPWTTDEPECLVKPPVKDITIPIDLKLHSDIRAMERAEFDHQVAEKMSLIEQYRMERERQQKFAEEEELRRLRKELVPKAQPMPYFDRPFIPRRSMKHPTIPKEPKFHIPQHKKMKCSLSWNDISSSYAYHQ